MIIDYRENNEHVGDISPIDILLGEKYSVLGNIIVEHFTIDQQKSETQIRFNLPNVTNEAGILFSLLFLEQISKFVNVYRGINTDISNNQIKHKLLLKQSEESIIVIPEIRTLAISDRLSRVVNTSKQYQDRIHFSDLLSTSESELIIDLFHKIVKTFRLTSIFI